MFGRKASNGIPYIEDVSYLDHYNLFVTFENNEQRIFDASQNLNCSPRGRLYLPIDKFKEFRYNRCMIYWGDEDKSTDHQIFRDSIYDFSFPFLAIVSSSGQIVSLSMSRVKGVTDFPIRNQEKLPVPFVHANEADRHKFPHVHINYKTTDEPFKLDGTPINSSINNPPYSGKILKVFKKWIIDNRTAIVEEWNKENPENPLDPKTGNYIQRET